MTSQRDIETETLNKASILVKVGSHKLTIPVVTVILAVLGALGTAYRVVASELGELHAADAHAAEAIQTCKGQLATTEILLSGIQTQLARIDARVAEIQVTLMRAGRP